MPQDSNLLLQSSKDMKDVRLTLLVIAFDRLKYLYIYGALIHFKTCADPAS